MVRLNIMDAIARYSISAFHFVTASRAKVAYSLSVTPTRFMMGRSLLLSVRIAVEISLCTSLAPFLILLFESLRQCRALASASAQQTPAVALVHAIPNVSLTWLSKHPFPLRVWYPPNGTFFWTSPRWSSLSSDERSIWLSLHEPGSGK
jgi:hypothetical protein